MEEFLKEKVVSDVLAYYKTFSGLSLLIFRIKLPEIVLHLLICGHSYLKKVAGMCCPSGTTAVLGKTCGQRTYPHTQQYTPCNWLHCGSCTIIGRTCTLESRGRQTKSSRWSSTSQSTGAEQVDCRGTQFSFRPDGFCFGVVRDCNWLGRIERSRLDLETFRL